MTHDGRPIDSDVVDAPALRERPPHLHWRFISLVALGGVVGSALREAIALALPHLDFPIATFTVNVLGAVGLGMLLEALARRGADEGRRRRLRLMVGTGFFGGFTTYSTFSVETAQLLGSEQLSLGVSYALATLILGAVATTLGIAVSAALHRRRTRMGGTA